MKRNTDEIKRDEEDLDRILGALPANPIPWGPVLAMTAPFIARLAVRYALKRLKRGLAEEKVNTIANATAVLINGIVSRHKPGETP